MPKDAFLILGTGSYDSGWRRKKSLLYKYQYAIPQNLDQDIRWKMWYNCIGNLVVEREWYDVQAKAIWSGV